MGKLSLATIGLVALLGFATVPGLGLEPAPQTVETVSKKCCKICHKGKACGDSCIPRDRECHKPPGCACDG